MRGLVFISSVILIIVASVIAVVTFGASAAGMIALAVVLAAGLIGMTVAAGAWGSSFTVSGTRLAPFLFVTNGRQTNTVASICFYKGEAYSEGATVAMDDGSVYECKPGGKWEPIDH